MEGKQLLKPWTLKKGSGGSRGALSPCRGPGAMPSGERGGPRSSHGVCGIAWPRGKAQPQGAFPWGVPPSNPNDSNPLSCSLLPGLLPFNPGSSGPGTPVLLLRLGSPWLPGFSQEARVQSLKDFAFGSHSPGHT